MIDHNASRKWLRAGAMAALLVASSSLAVARAADPDTASVDVVYSDLDLSTDAGVAALRHRIMKAALNVCQQVEEGYKGSLTDLAACRSQAFSEAMANAKVRIAAARQSSKYAGNAPR